jgi:hypothetical protein
MLQPAPPSWAGMAIPNDGEGNASIPEVQIQLDSDLRAPSGQWQHLVSEGQEGVGFQQDPNSQYLSLVVGDTSDSVSTQGNLEDRIDGHLSVNNQTNIIYHDSSSPSRFFPLSLFIPSLLLTST